MLICVTKLVVAKAVTKASPLAAFGFTEYLALTLFTVSDGVPIAALKVKAPVVGFIVAKIGRGRRLEVPPIV